MKKHEPLNLMFVSIGYGNMVAASRVIAVVSPEGAPMKRLRDEARQRGMLVDATEGRRTRSIIITDSGHVMLSSLQSETLAERFMAGFDNAGEDDGQGKD